MNSKGHVAIYGFMLAATIFVLALALAFPVKQTADTARTDMNCTSTNLSYFDKGGCLVTDLTPAYFVGALLGIAGLIFGAKIILG